MLKRWMKNLKIRLFDWLGITQMQAEIAALKNQAAWTKQLLRQYQDGAIDVGLKNEQSMFVLISRLDGGKVIFVPIKFKTVPEIRESVDLIKRTWGVDQVTWDTPDRSFNHWINDQERWSKW